MDYDVIVVGAGPAGSTAAKNLAEKGIKVLLLDKATFPREKPCGGGLPTRVQKRFPYIQPFIDSISYGSSTYSSSLRYKFDLIREKPFLMMVLRKDFDFGLLSLAKQAGAVFLNGRSVVDVVVQKEKVSVMLDDGQTMESQVVIGCDGMHSVVAEKTNLCKQLEVICVALMQEQPMTPKQLTRFFTKKHLIYLFIKAHGIAGYAWVFPKKNCVNIGIGEFQSAVSKARPKIPLKETYEALITVMKEKKLLPAEFPIENLRGATLPIFPLENTCGDRVLLCGDAAGFINPITGEGIYYAMTSGSIAANVITDGLKAGDLSHHFLSRYQTLWMDDFGKDLKALGRFNNQWGKDSEKIVRLMMRDKKFARLIIGVTGGQISLTKYKKALIIRYIYAFFKDLFSKKEK
ncbi:MAG TPA: geranylgeranyl reductase family protein [Candidatus Thermoplasmatota archaeon]|nr:geranylgeranyl reductase family protein [Candidatus Thermoplasmatota archaeon]